MRRFCLLAVFCSCSRDLERLKSADAPIGIAYTDNAPVYFAGQAIAPNQATVTGGRPTEMSISPLLPAGLLFDVSTGTISGTPARSAPRGDYRVRAQNGFGVAETTLSLSVTDVAPEGLSYARNPAVFVQATPAEANAPKTTRGVPIAYAITPALPLGLALDTQTGVISGTPAVRQGAADYVVTARNDFGETTTTLNLLVQGAPPDLVYPFPHYDFVAGRISDTGLPANLGGPITHCNAIDALPIGLSVDDRTCAIRGVPQGTRARANYAVGAQYDGGIAAFLIDITINTRLNVFPPRATLTARSNAQMQLTASGGAPPYVFQLASGSGSVSAAGLYTAANREGLTRVDVTDSTGDTFTVIIDERAVFTNSSVQAVRPDTNGLYLGGIFTAVFPSLKPGLLALDAATGAVDETFDVAQGIDRGSIQAITADATTLLAVGSFDRMMGDWSPRIAAIDLSTNRPSQGFSAPGVFDHRPVAIARLGTSVYVGGNFTVAGGVGRAGVARLNATTGEVDPSFNAALLKGGASPGRVNALVAEASRVLIAGSFDSVAGVSGYASIVAVSPSGTFSAPSAGISGGEVYAVASTGDAVFIGGNFSSPVGGLAKLDGQTLTPVPFRSGSGFDDTVFALAAAGDDVYVGGAFGNVDGAQLSALTKLSARTGVIDSAFSAQPGFDDNAEVYALLVEGDTLVVGGDFRSYRGTQVRGLVFLNRHTGALLTQTRDVGGNAGSGWGKVLTLAAADTATGGRRIYAGGDFLVYGGQPRPGLARLNKGTHTLATAFNPAMGFASDIRALASEPTSHVVYAGGLPTNPDGSSAQRVLKIDDTTGAVLPGLTAPTNGFVSALAVANTGALHTLDIGGNFTLSPHQSFVRLNASGAVSRGLALNGAVSALVTADPLVDLVGDFTLVGATPVSHSVRFNASNSTFAPLFHFSASPYSPSMFGIAAFVDYRYFVGTFTKAGSAANPSTAAHAVYATNGAVSALSPMADDDPSIDGTLYALAAGDTNVVYFGGEFSKFRTSFRAERLVAWRTGSGEDKPLSGFSIGNGFDNTIFKLVYAPDALYVAGVFAKYQDILRPWFCIIDPLTGAPLP